MRNKNYTATADFLKRFFSETLHKVELRACPNVKGQTGALSRMTDSDFQRMNFCIEKDVDGIGVYFGICTRQDGATSGNLETVAECPALWVDIDCAKQGIGGDDALAALNFLPHPPSLIVNSGGGLHAYWLLEEPVDVSIGQQAREVVTACLRQLALVLAGDLQCAELARILRLPGTMNSKVTTKALYDGEPAICEVIEDSGRVHDFETLRLWLGTQRAVLHGKVAEVRPVVETDPFARYAREAGYEPAIDVEAELAGIIPGHDKHGIHPTQLRVSMSLAARGYGDDEIVDMLLKACAPHAPANDPWDWAAEEKAIRKMIASAKRKVDERKAERPVPPQLVSNGNAAVAVVHDIEQERAKREPKQKLEKGVDEISAAGEAVIGVWQERYGPLAHVHGTSYAYVDGIWIEWDDTANARLRSLVQEACQKLRIKPSTSIINAVYRYVMERPALRRDDVTFDNHGLLVATDACLCLKTYEIVPHSPDHFATMKVAATLEGERECPTLLGFLRDAFSDRGDAAEIIATIQEWFGAAIVPLHVKQRGQRKGMLVHGPSHTGKTQLSELARHLLGHRHVSGARMSDLEDRFGTEPLIGKRGWIADDAIGEAETLNAETYKVVVTGEQTGCRRKGGKNWEGRFGIPVMFTANNLPRVKDQSDATFNRSLILPMTRVRGEHEPEPEGYESISAKIGAEELTGLLWWAIEGWKRLAARGTFAPPPIMLEAGKSFKDDNNPVGAWLNQCAMIDRECKIARLDLVASFNGWRALEHDDAKPWTSNTVTRRIEAIMPGLGRTKYAGERMFIGIRLNEDGLFSWQRTKDTSGFEKKSTYSNDQLEVNRWHEVEAPQPTETKDRKPRF